MDIDKLYNEIILQYAKDKNNISTIEDTKYVERGHNPSCGDDLTLFLDIKDNEIFNAKFIGNGCAISTASMNIMISLIKEKSVKEAKEILDIFFKMMNGDDLNIDKLEDAKVLKITINSIARKKCATLSWHSLKLLLN